MILKEEDQISCSTNANTISKAGHRRPNFSLPVSAKCAESTSIKLLTGLSVEKIASMIPEYARSELGPFTCMLQIQSSEENDSLKLFDEVATLATISSQMLFTSADSFAEGKSVFSDEIKQKVFLLKQEIKTRHFTSPEVKKLLGDNADQVRPSTELAKKILEAVALIRESYQKAMFVKGKETHSMTFNRMKEQSRNCPLLFFEKKEKPEVFLLLDFEKSSKQRKKRYRTKSIMDPYKLVDSNSFQNFSEKKLEVPKPVSFQSSRFMTSNLHNIFMNHLFSNSSSTKKIDRLNPEVSANGSQARDFQATSGKNDELANEVAYQNFNLSLPPPIVSEPIAVLNRNSTFNYDTKRLLISPTQQMEPEYSKLPSVVSIQDLNFSPQRIKAEKLPIEEIPIFEPIQANVSFLPFSPEVPVKVFQNCKFEDAPKIFTERKREPTPDYSKTEQFAIPIFEPFPTLIDDSFKNELFSKEIRENDNLESARSFENNFLPNQIGNNKNQYFPFEHIQTNNETDWQINRKNEVPHLYNEFPTKLNQNEEDKNSTQVRLDFLSFDNFETAPHTKTQNEPHSENNINVPQFFHQEVADQKIERLFEAPIQANLYQTEPDPYFNFSTFANYSAPTTPETEFCHQNEFFQPKNKQKFFGKSSLFSKVSDVLDRFDQNTPKLSLKTEQMPVIYVKEPPIKKVFVINHRPEQRFSLLNRLPPILAGPRGPIALEMNERAQRHSEKPFF